MVAKGHKNTEIGVIPEDWEIMTYDDVFIFLKTATYSRAELTENDNIGYVHYGDIHTKCQSYYLDLDTIILPTISFDQLKNYAYIQNGDIIVADASEDYLGVGKSVEIKNIRNRKVISGLHTFLLRSKNDNIVNGFKGLIFYNKLVKQQIDTYATGLKVYSISKNILKTIQIPFPPTKAEQTAIATALSDADALITATEKLIAKKKAIKQGAMQELLKPKEGWENIIIDKLGKTFGGLSGKSKNDFENGNCPYIPFMNIMSNSVIDTTYLEYVNIKDGESQNKALQGDLFFNTSSETPEEVGMCSVLLENIPNLYLNSFCFGFRLNSKLKNNGLYLSYFFRSIYGRELLFSLAQGATRHNLSKNNFLKTEIKLPKQSEQTRIATILSDMDAEISLLEQKLEKQKQIKQGMMQNLLTGKIRLLRNIEKQQIPTNKVINISAKDKNTKYQDAVLITAIVNAFYSEKYPLGRKKVQKLLYLVRRKQEIGVSTFMRKPAGPYAHEVRYNGGEAIAKSKHYVSAKSNKQGTVFSKGNNSDEALAYIEKWEMQSHIDWLELEFKYKNVNQLEVLTTIDMAICDLEKENERVSLQTVKELIEADKEWEKKLEKSYFSDTEIQKAINESNRLFGNG